MYNASSVGVVQTSNTRRSTAVCYIAHQTTDSEKGRARPLTHLLKMKQCSRSTESWFEKQNKTKQNRDVDIKK